MKNLRQTPGDQVTIVAGSAISAGDVVVVRAGTTGLCGIAAKDIASGDEGEVVVKNAVVELTAESGTGKTFTAGDKLYWDGDKLTKTATDNDYAGIAAKAKTAAADTAYLALGL